MAGPCVKRPAGGRLRETEAKARKPSSSWEHNGPVEKAKESFLALGWAKAAWGK